MLVQAQLPITVARLCPQVVLERLSPAAQAALDRHNSGALSQLVAYVERYVAGLGPDGGAAARAAEALPLSGLQLPAWAGGAEGAGEDCDAGFCLGCALL